MKHSLIFCAIALVAVAVNSASAQVSVQLNLRYDDPANESAGGSWDLLVLSDATNGLAGLQVILDGVTGVTDIDTGTITPNSDAFVDGDSIFRFAPISGGNVLITAGDDLDGALVVGVGTPGSASVVVDDLFPGNSPTWNNSSLLASGFFGAARPSFVDVDATGNVVAAGTGVLALANEFANPATGTLVAASVDLTSVRGDGVATDGLISGDSDRSGVVNLDDFNRVVNNFGAPAAGWDLGSTDGIAGVALDDFNNVVNNFGSSASSPPVSAVSSVPEPSTILLAATLFSLCTFVRRNK